MDPKQQSNQKSAGVSAPVVNPNPVPSLRKPLGGANNTSVHLHSRMIGDRLDRISTYITRNRDGTTRNLTIHLIKPNEICCHKKKKKKKKNKSPKLNNVLKKKGEAFTSRS